MNSDVLLIVLTENSWLYAGLTALLPEVNCVLLKFNSKKLPDNVMHAGRVMVVVDSFILFRGEWGGFNHLKSYRPDITVCWLTRKETGRGFPVNSCGDRVLNQQQDLISMRNALLGHFRKKEIETYVMPINLTLTERILLPDILSGMNVKLLSRITGKSVKTLYSHRQQILAKTGFRQFVFLQFVYIKNLGLPYAKQ
ncbi:transcriptional regulator [Enterobacter cancerogenus]|uniref:helix-turn-helix transcriptional regulator n=1 Tax=Enterobacter cancerogenus TaxID=69218 RepID=UPI00307647EB